MCENGNLSQKFTRKDCRAEHYVLLIIIVQHMMEDIMWTIDERRNRLDLIELFKICKGMSRIKLNDLFTLDGNAVQVVFLPQIKSCKVCC